MQKKYFTLVFIKNKNNDKILLGRKKRDFGAGLINGFGGKLEPNEDKFDCAVREIKEECNLDVRVEDLRDLGYVSFRESQEERIVYIFTVSRFKGEIIESDEMEPAWFDINNMPLQQMHQDFSMWYQLVVHDVKFKIEF